MANYATLKAAIQNVIKTNGNNEITGALLQQTLLLMIDSLGYASQFMGFANEATNPGTPDFNVSYLAGPGTYPNFGGTVVGKGQIAVFGYNGSWTYTVKSVISIFDDLRVGPNDQALSAKQGSVLFAKILGESANFTDIKFEREHCYINTNGVPTVSSGDVNCTELIEVKPGDVFYFTGFFGATTGLYNVWGYSDVDLTTKTPLLATGTAYKNQQITIPSGINYIAAWGLSTGNTGLKLYKQNNIENQIAGINELISNYILFVDPFNNTRAGYIDSGGGYNSSAVGVVTNYFPVKPGDVIKFRGGWTVNDQIGLVWGYDSNKQNPQKLVGAQTNVDTEFVVPSGVYYLMAWSLPEKNPTIVNESALNVRIQELETTVADLVTQMGRIFDIQDTTALANMTANNEGGNDWVVVNNGASVNKKGYLRKISFYSTSIAQFYIGVFKSNGIINNKLQLVLREKIAIAGTVTGHNTVSVNIPVEAGDYIGVCGNGINNMPNYGPSITNGWYWLASTGSTIAVGDTVNMTLLPNYTMAIGFELESSIFEYADDEEESVTTIVATRNANDYNSIRDIMESITDATEKNQYVIFVPKGRWFECDIQGKAFVTIVGEDREETVLYCDGTSSNVTPANYSYSGQENKPLNSILQQYKHCVFAKKNVAMKNLTVEVTECKYCVHLDNPGFKEAYFDNCHFTTFTGVNYAIGIGIRGGQKIDVKDSIIERSDGLNGIFAHNWNNQTSPSFIKFENCYFLRCGIGTIDELGSEQADEWAFINCYSDRGGRIIWMVDITSDGNTYWVNPATGEREPNPQNVPYCIRLNCLGTNVECAYTSLFSSANPIITRPEFPKSMLTEHFIKIPSSGLSVGQVLFGAKSGNSIIIDFNLPLLGVVECIVDGFAYIADKVVYVAPENIIGSPSVYSLLYYNYSERKFTTTQGGNPIGYVLSDYNGLFKLIKLL